MRTTVWMALAGLLLAWPALADECPSHGEPDATAAAIRAAPTCKAAGRIARACSVVAGGDVAIAGAASEVCERDHLSRLGRRDRAAYDRERATCRAKHRDEAGSMYRSFEAFCELRVAERFSQRALGATAGR